MGLLLERFGTQEFKWLVDGRRVDPASIDVSADMRVELRHLNDSGSPPALNIQSASPPSAGDVGERPVSSESDADRTVALQPLNEFQPPPPLDIQPADQQPARVAVKRLASMEIVRNRRVGLRPRSNLQPPRTLDVQPAVQPLGGEFAEQPQTIGIVMDDGMELRPQDNFQSHSPSPSPSPPPPPPVVRRTRRRSAAAAAEGSVISPTITKRKQHAEVEARYRSSLNLAFYRLGQTVHDGRGGLPSQLHKAKVLDSAREYICKLQTDMSVLAEENKHLREMLRVSSSRPSSASPLAIEQGPAGDSVSEAEESGG
jgi:Helix-loop-helix DNA-binding domain